MKMYKKRMFKTPEKYREHEILKAALLSVENRIFALKTRLDVLETKRQMILKRIRIVREK